jgi:hypothetical protein
LQCETHVRDNDSVTLRENVTRRRIPPESRRAQSRPIAIAAPPARCRILLGRCAASFPCSR